MTKQDCEVAAKTQLLSLDGSRPLPPPANPG